MGDEVRTDRRTNGFAGWPTWTGSNENLYENPIKRPTNYSKDDNSSQVIALYGFLFELPGLDSNQDKENQNLLCYRYTTG